ncbi:hypothetical protein [Streptomyces sp. V1I6]|uniref:hypothetical protein n=1 Tax=Streptomyces sp. V1I6 TaxID=3042273 RepID=UPI002780B3E7|nr:hypothetical protein [Streptomyces sp. V1I6]MDQ0840574.1 GGDEF domain-containing protein [Streptomyces sp. V1I6]
MRSSPSSKSKSQAGCVSHPILFGEDRLPLAVSLGAATPAAVGSRELPVLMRAADTAMYEGKHTGRIVHARPDHAHTPTINGRRQGRPSTATPTTPTP